MAELCDIYDVNGNKTGEVFVRGEMFELPKSHLRQELSHEQWAFPVFGQSPKTLPL